MEFNEINNYKPRKAISEYDLEQIFLVQYNDLFSKLLLKTVEEFFMLLKKQVILHLKIIDKQYDSSLISFFYNKYYYIIQNDKFRIQNIYQEMVTYPDQNFLYLNTLDVYIHCYKCKDAIHKCGNKLIIYDNLFFCINCKKVYNENQIKLYCKECNKTYLTTRRSAKDQQYEYLYSVSFMNYHCFLENEEKIKCLNCGDDLYYNITKIPTERERNGIRDIYCINCKLIFDTKQIFFNCKICGENFKSTPQIYRNFSSIKKYLLLLVHTFRKGVYAVPNLITNKKCNCNINGILYYLHNDNGTLFEGKKNGKNVIICDCCFGIFKPDNFSWNCPFCRRSFKSVKSHYIPHRRNNIRIVKKQKDMFYQSNSNANNYNNINREYKYNNDYYDSLAYHNENSNYNTSRQLENSASVNSLSHNRGLSLNANNNKRIYLYDNYNYIYNNSLNNNMTNANKNDSKIFFKFGNYSRNNSHDEYFSNKGRNENTQNMNLNYRNYKLLNYYNNENANTNINVNNYNNDGLKRSISNFDKLYQNNNINAFNNIKNNIRIENNYNMSNINKNYNNNYYNVVENANIDKNSIELPSNQGMMMKISKSHYNIKQPIKEEINRIPKNQRKKIFEKKMELNPFKSYNNNNNNINISINNNLIQMNYSSHLNSQKKENNKTTPRIVANKSVSKINEMKDKNKSQYTNNININNTNSNRKNNKNSNNNSNNKEMYKKKRIIEQNLDGKTPKLYLKNDGIKGNDIIEKNNNILFRSTPIKIEPKQKIKKENIIMRNKNFVNKNIKFNNINIIKDKVNNTYINSNVENNNISTNISHKNSFKLDENSNINKKEQIDNISNNNKKGNTPQVITKIRIYNKDEKTPQIKTDNINLIKNNNNLRNQSISKNQVNKLRKSAKHNIKVNDMNLPKHKDEISLNNFKNNDNIKNMVFIRMNNENEENGDKKEVINKTEITIKEISKELECGPNNNIKTEKHPIDSNPNKNKSNNMSRVKEDRYSNNINNNENENNQNKSEYMNNNLVHKKKILSLNLINDSKNDLNFKKSEKNSEKVNKTIKKIEITNNNINQTNTENSKNINNLKMKATAKKKDMKKLNDKINKIVINDISNELNNVVENKLNNNSQNTNTNKIKMHKSINYLNNNIKKNNNPKINNTPNKILSKSMKFISTNYNNNNDNNNSENTMNNKVKKNIIKHNIINESNIRKNIDDIINNKSNQVEQHSKLNNINSYININKNENIIGNINDNKIVNPINNINLNSINDNKSKNNSNKKINHNNNSSIINNKMININEDINKSPNKKLLGNNIVYKDISKSVNNNLSINNIVNDNVNSNIDNNNKNIINLPVININNLNDNTNITNNQINKNINNDINQNDNKIKENVDLNNIKDHPQDSIIKNGKIINSQNITPKKNNIDSANEANNINQNSNKKIIINNNLIIRQKKRKEIKEDSNVLKLKKYFAIMGREKDQNIKRKSSFDCRQSRSHFKLYNNQDNEVKTFDSNYYKIIKPIGKGTYGEIYLVQDPKTSALFALKKIIISDALELRDNQEEYKLTWKLTHANPHLKIVKKYAIEIKKLDKYNLVMYILMEAANCDWEHELLNRQKANAFYTENELLTILKSLVETFLVLQNKGISHRDVKPQNILCFGNEGYKLTDFGEAKSRIKKSGLRNLYGFEQNTSKQTVRGTELYMSPILFNALRSKKLDGAQYNAYKSDVFSLGMCFLLASSLNYQSLFEIREVLDMKIIEEVVNKFLGKMYSKKYINLIISMLQTDEKIRPDFIELSSNLVKNFN